MHFLLFLVIIITPSFLWSLNHYDAIESLLRNDDIPRILNSEDFSNLNPNDPQPLFSPQGDFNQDGLPDVAISGIFSLKEGRGIYFLLVATVKKRPFRYEKLFFKTYDKPIFIHKPGTTGLGDPGDQAFSISFCSKCDQGFDFYWLPKGSFFKEVPWKPKIKRFTTTIEEPKPEIADEVVEKALKIVGQLEDVQIYTKRLKETQRTLGVHVDSYENEKKQNYYWVNIFERKGELEKVPYDRILVDIKKMKVLKRENTDQ